MCGFGLEAERSRRCGNRGLLAVVGRPPGMPSLKNYVDDIRAEPMTGLKMCEQLPKRMASLNDSQLAGMRRLADLEATRERAAEVLVGLDRGEL